MQLARFGHGARHYPQLLDVLRAVSFHRTASGEAIWPLESLFAPAMPPDPPFVCFLRRNDVPAARKVACRESRQEFGRPFTGCRAAPPAAAAAHAAAGPAPSAPSSVPSPRQGLPVARLRQSWAAPGA